MLAHMVHLFTLEAGFAGGFWPSGGFVGRFWSPGGLLIGSAVLISIAMSIAISVLRGTGEEDLMRISNGFSIDGANGGEPGEEDINHSVCP